MLLPIPSEEPMGPDNMLDTSSAKHILQDYADTVRIHTARLSRGRAFGTRLEARDFDEVQVFDKGSYTIALAENARDLTGAVGRIPAKRRPKVNAAIFEAYDKFYPRWKMALCAWDGTIDAEPLLWWYAPMDRASLFMPALDAHDGLPPKLGATVEVDHTLAFGSVLAQNNKDGWPVRFRDELPAHLKPFLATSIRGIESKSPLVNGDFTAQLSKIHSGIIARELPPGATLTP
jgi:hypothetical protein